MPNGVNVTHLKFVRFITSTALFVGISITAAAGYSPSLPPDPELDRLLLQLSVKSNIPLPSECAERPYNYHSVATFFSRVLASGVQLSNPERHAIALSLKRYGSDSGLYHWADTSQNLHLKINCNLLGDVQPGYDDSGTMQLSGIAEPSLTGSLGNISWYSGIRVWTEYRSDTLFPFCTYQPYDGVAYNLYGRASESSTRSSDLPFGGISYDAGRVRLETAIDYLRTGPALFFPLTLSGNAPPVTYFRGSMDLSKIHYRHTIALLKSQKDKRKYLFNHRLSGNFWKDRVQFGINETVIYGNTTSQPHAEIDSVLPVYRQDDRTFDWEYFIPFLPFKFVEHYSGDRDNAAISFDAALFWPASYRFYMEFFLDDMLSPWKLFTNDWGNKWACTMGANYFGKLCNRDLTLLAEVSRVEPWVYTHFNGGSHRYTHFSSSIGAQAGPNSLSSVLMGLIKVHPLHETGFGIQQLAYNHTVRGGSITDVFQHEDPDDTTRYHDATTKEFLGKGTLWHLRPSLYWKFNTFGTFALDAVFMVDVLENAGALSFRINGGLYF